MKHTARLAASLVGGAALVAAVPALAGAHVHLDADSTAAGSSSLVTLAFSHGCEGAPTTKLSIKMPASIASVAPTAKPGWAIQLVRVKLDRPVTTADGRTLTDRVDQVIYTASTPVPDGIRDTVDLAVKLPADAAGTTLVFPVVQSCTKGENAWVQVPTDGQDADALDAPAPTLEVSAASAESAAEHGHGGTHTSGDTQAGAAAHTQHTAAEVTPADLGGTSGLALVGAVSGLAGLAAGGTALVLGRRRS